MFGELKLDSDNKKLAARYLLGELSEEDSARLEDSSFSDPDQLEELWEVENDLIDGYARDELPPVEREKFGRLFLAHPDRRERVEFALAMARLSTHRARSSAGTVTRRGWFASFFGRRLTLTFAAAAFFLILAVGVWWLFTRTSSRPREQLAQRQEPGQLPAPSQGQPGSSPQTNVNAQPAEPAPKVGKGAENSEGGRGAGSKPTPAAPRQQPSVVAFMLPPGLSRSSSERTKLIVPHGRQLMRLRLELEEHEAVNYGVFAADLSRAGVAVWQLGSLVIPQPKRNRTLVLSIPVDKLATDAGDYELTLKGRPVNGQAFETISYYYLTIVKE